MFLAYIRRYDIIESYDHRGSVQQEVAIYKYFKGLLTNFAEKMSNCKIATEKESIVFVIDTPACDFDDKQRRIFEVFCLDKNEYLKKGSLDFHIYDEDTGIRIQHYSFSFSKKEDVAGYEIAQTSIEKYGIEPVCAAIAHEMQAFNFGEDEDKRNNFFAELEESIDKIDSGESECKDADEVFAELKESLRSKCTPEQNEYFDAQDEFDAKIKHLKDAWWKKEINKKHQVLIDFIKKEYNRNTN